MLIVINGAETIRKTKLTSMINTALNKISITNINGTTEDFWKEQLYISNSNHYKMQFRNVFYDYGATTDRVFPDGGDYQKLINSYQARTTEFVIISGSFSKLFVEKVTEDLKTDAMFVNITRHPSVIYVVDAAQPDPYGPYDTDIVIPMLKRRNISSLLNTVTLKRLPEVTSIKFEDIISQGKLTINNINIDVSNDYKNHNGLLTQSELLPLAVSDENVKLFNKKFQALNSTLKASTFELPTKIFEQLPENVFEKLDYSPLDLEQIF